jgi:hypothetical protein
VSDERPEGLDWPDPVRPAAELEAAQGGSPEQEAAMDPARGAAGREAGGDEVEAPDAGVAEGESSPDAAAPREGAVALLGRDLIIPIRSSSGRSPEPGQVTIDGMRHGTDEQGRFLAAFSSQEAFEQLGPPGSDRVMVGGRELLELAERAGERVIVDPGWNGQIEIPAGILPFLVAGIDLASPAALRARRPLGALPPLERPASVPEPFGSELRGALTELPAVQRAWLLRVGTAWTVGIELADDAPLSDFDVARNRLHALASEHLGSRRDLVITDLRAPALRAHYESVAPPYYVPPAPKGFFSRLLSRD